MKTLSSTLLFFCLCLFMSCTEEDLSPTELVDDQGPEIYDVRWIDHPSIDNDPAGPIANRGNYTISIEAGFQVRMTIKDIHEIKTGALYFLVNDDEEIREDIVKEGSILDYKEGSIGFIRRGNKISIGNSVFYNLQPGDTYHFYANFTDELGNHSSYTWTADLVE